MQEYYESRVQPDEAAPAESTRAAEKQGQRYPGNIDDVYKRANEMYLNTVDDSDDDSDDDEPINGAVEAEYMSWTTQKWERKFLKDIDLLEFWGVSRTNYNLLWPFLTHTT